MVVFESSRGQTGVALLVVVVAAAAGLLLPARPASIPPPAPEVRCGSPAGYTEMRFDEITPRATGQYAVDLVDDTRRITIYVGSSEGRAISLRSDGRRFFRPLTVDLLDATLRELGGTVERVQVDTLVDNTFHGSLHLLQRGRTLRIDARPSDAIAVAIGNHAPIFVSEEVLAAVGERR
jgi:uncharacterized protein